MLVEFTPQALCLRPLRLGHQPDAYPMHTPMHAPMQWSRLRTVAGTLAHAHVLD